MGRKIPAKKHRGVKDPLLQQARRLQSVKNKINAPPRDPDEQPVPRSVTRLFHLAERHALAPSAKRPKRPKRPPHAGERGGGAVAALRRLPGEAGRAFGQRISAAVRALQGGPGAGPGYGSDSEGSEEDAKGARMAWQRQRRAKRTARRAAAAGGTAVGERGAAPRGLTRQQRRRLRLKEKKADKEGGAEGADGAVYERVPFGAEPRAPPALRPPRRAPAALAAGARGLVLKQMLAGGAIEAERRERARLQAVEAYRALKKTRARPTGPSPARPH